MTGRNSLDYQRVSNLQVPTI